jgi:hypothetical protein
VFDRNVGESADQDDGISLMVVGTTTCAVGVHLYDYNNMKHQGVDLPRLAHVLVRVRGYNLKQENLFMFQRRQ